jgi:hypothetical protein
MNIEDQILKEIDHLTSIIQNEERQAEQRIQFFLMLAVGSISLIALFEKWEVFKDGRFSYAVITTLSILFLYGLHTLNRINWRTIYINSSHSRMKSAFQALAKTNPHFKIAVSSIDKIDDKSNFRRKVRGSPAEFMYLTNALILTGIVLSLGIQHCWSQALLFLACGSTIVATLFVLYQYSLRFRNTIIKQMESPRTDSGAAPNTQETDAQR